jgi:hemoglobin
MARTTLYNKLGGYDAIAAVVDDLMMKMATDQRLAKYFVGHSEDSKKRIRQLQVDMISQATGGPSFYLGRDMRTIHKGLNIDGTEWQLAITYIIHILNNFKVEDADQKEVLTLLNSIKGDVVEKP